MQKSQPRYYQIKASSAFKKCLTIKEALSQKYKRDGTSGENQCNSHQTGKGEKPFNPLSRPGNAFKHSMLIRGRTSSELQAKGRFPSVQPKTILTGEPGGVPWQSEARQKDALFFGGVLALSCSVWLPACGHRWFFHCNYKFSSQVSLAIFQVLNSHMWLLYLITQL